MAERFELVEKALLKMLEDKKYATLRDILVTMNPIDVAGLFNDLEDKQIPLLFRGALSPKLYQIIFPTVCMVNILITSFSHTIVSVGYDLWGGYPMVLLVSAGGLALCAVIALGLQLQSRKAK